MARVRGSTGRITTLLVALLATPPLGAQVVASLSTQLPKDAPDSAAISTRFDSLIAVALTGAGFTVLGTVPTDSVWRESLASVGGYFDPHTGRLIPERLRAIRIATLAPFHEISGATLLLTPRVIVVQVRHYGDMAEWDGVRERIGSAGGLQGDMPALSLLMMVSDSSGERVHCARGGIQVLQKGNFWHGPRNIDDRKVLTDQKKDSAAVALVLAGLIAHHLTCEVAP